MKQYPWSSRMNRMSIEAISVTAQGSPPRLTQAQIETVTQRLEMWGVAVVQNAATADHCDSARKWLLAEINKPTARFGDVRSPKYRKDMPLNLTNSPEASRAFQSAVGTLQAAYKHTLGEKAVLVELSSLTSLPGTKAQRPHPDAGLDSIDDFHKAVVLSSFMALDDVKDNQAALDVWPGSHTFYHFLSPRNQEVILKMVSPIRMSVPKGSVVIMDSRTLHRGTANKSRKPRPVVYWSLMSDEGLPPVGPTYSILKTYLNGNSHGNLTTQDIIDTDFTTLKASSALLNAAVGPDPTETHFLETAKSKDNKEKGTKREDNEEDPMADLKEDLNDRGQGPRPRTDL